MHDARPQGSPHRAHVLAIPGSLRAASINRAFCRAAARLAPDDIEVEVYDGLGGLALYNPDWEQSPPRPVRALRAAIVRADAVFIASPEYAHGIAAPLKNALDWLVSFEGFVFKPTGVVNLAPRAFHARDALLEVLATMSANLVPAACVTVALPRGCVDEDAITGAAEVVPAIRALLMALVARA